MKRSLLTLTASAALLLAMSSSALAVNLADGPAQALLDKGITAALKNQNANAKKDFSEVLQNSKTDSLKNTAHLELARVLFQENNLKEALSEYEKIPKDSTLWIKALDERAWTQLRMGHPEKALGELKTVLNPAFAGQVGSEPFFLQALSQLRICDYPGVFKTIQDFKKRVTPSAAGLQAKANAGDTQAKVEAEKLSDIISKLQLVEVEAIQRVYVIDSKSRRTTISKIDKKRDQLSFPDSEEVWLDELDSYQVQAKNCPTLGGLSK